MSVNKNSKAVIVGDVHLGFGSVPETDVSSNSELFKEFIETEVVDIDPDVLIINGDLAELWRSSFSSVMVNYSEIFTAITELKQEHGIDIVPIVGNHDYRMIETGRDLIGEPEEIWSFEEEFYFSSGDKEFVVTHGHRTDSINRSRVQNNALCLTSDDVGSSLSSVWSRALDRPMLGWLIERDTIIGPDAHDPFVLDGPLLSRPNLRVLSHINNPGELSEDESAGRFARSIALLKAKYDETIIAGHTHVQEAQPEDGYYNHGDWLGDDSGYIVVEDGEIDVRQYSDEI